MPLPQSYTLTMTEKHAGVARAALDVLGEVYACRFAVASDVLERLSLTSEESAVRLQVLREELTELTALTKREPLRQLRLTSADVSTEMTLTPEQGDDLVRATDLYARIIMGQLQDMPDVCVWHVGFNDDSHCGTMRFAKEYIGARETYATGLNHRGAYHGIHSPEISDEARIAWDLQQVVRNRIAHDSLVDGAKPTWQVSFDTPRRSSKTVDTLPTIQAGV